MRIDDVKEKCTGCGGCVAICPTGAIMMVEDEEGFEIPHINEEKCIKCGKCYNLCHTNKKDENEKVQQAYYGRAKSKDVLEKSSSGGMYYPIAKYLVAQGYSVYGAVWDNEEKRVKHVSNEECDLEEQMGSKYLQSTTWQAFKKIKQELSEGKKVLFSGTPCQVAGLKKVVGDNKNLVTIDIICHGVPSYEILHERMKQLEEKHKSNITNIKFRSKIGKWSQHKLYVEFANKDIEIIPSSSDTYFQLFLNNCILRKSCYNCQYSNVQHEADITIADFWKLLKYAPQENDEKGTSILIINTKNGQEILEKVKDELYLKELPWNEASYVYKTHSNYQKEKRENFFKIYQEKGFKKAVKNTKNKKSLYTIVKSVLNKVEYRKISKQLTKKNRER